MKQQEGYEHYSNDGRLRDCMLLKVLVHVCEGRINALHYVDACHGIGWTKEGILHVYTEIQKRLKLRDLGPTSWFLGIDIQRNCSVGLITHPQHSIHRWYGGPFTCKDIHGPRSAPGKACESTQHWGGRFNECADEGPMDHNQTHPSLYIKGTVDYNPQYGPRT